MMPLVASRRHNCAKASTSARCTGDQPTATAPDEDLDGAIAFLQRNRMTDTVEVSRVIRLRQVVLLATGQQRGEPPAANSRSAAWAQRQQPPC